ncbi:DUF262 domain-containing protein [Hyphomonas sp. L-53-1-40]|uniref:GmrSD restriction endonuclease domain-containing protein n=1 Tax=Hyphomonas sp. L-53-1-40 TaxID=1207058 RepID=UPI000B0B7C9F|nr:DUF262 domain-containing protein [Hyphomonas sp. L-53-1-40]
MTENRLDGPIDWMEQGEDDEALSVTQFDITSSPNDFNLMTLMSFMDTGAIVIPHYQRNYTWDKKRASKLVESLIIGLPVPQLFFYEESRNKFAVLDGQQRLMSIYFFWKGRFPKTDKRGELREIFSDNNFFPPEVLADNQYFSEFSLYLPASTEERQSPFHQLKYETLDEHKSTLELRTIRSVIIKQNDPNPEEDGQSAVYEIFDRLNTGGMNLKPQEIRSNIYFSDFYNSINKLNKNAEWRKLIGRPNIDTNLRDVELLLRLFAMLTFSDKYSPSMTRFLNRFSAVAKKQFTQVEIELCEGIFEKFLEYCSKDFSAFSPGGRFSIGTTESVFRAAAREAWAVKNPSLVKNFSPAEVREIAEKIRDWLRVGSSKSENVQQRLDSAKEIIK